MRVVIERLSEDAIARKYPEKFKDTRGGIGDTCIHCGEKGTKEMGGEFSYEGSGSEGTKYRCSNCGVVGIDWYSLVWTATEICEYMDWETDEIRIPQDDEY